MRFGYTLLLAGALSLGIGIQAQADDFIPQKAGNVTISLPSGWEVRPKGVLKQFSQENGPEILLLAQGPADDFLKLSIIRNPDPGTQEAFLKQDAAQTEKRCKKLTGELDENTVAKTLRYYSEYIDSETRNGRSEEEVLDELGSPLLIARTILDTHVSGATDFSKKRTEQEPKEEEKGDKSHPWNKWLFLLILVAVLFLLFTILRVLLPVLLPVLLVLFLLSLFKKE